MPHAVMKHWHPMLGCDLHVPWPPGSPSPAPAPAPYFVCSTMFGLGVTAKYAVTHFSMGMGMTMVVPTDIGPGILHIGTPSITTPLDILFSASKSYFGPASYKAEGKPVAAALLIQVNPNLDCNSPVPWITGQVIALNTHYVGMTLGDILGGMFAMGADFLIQAALQLAGSKFGDLVKGALGSSAMMNFALALMGGGRTSQWLATVLARGAGPLISNYLATGASTIVGWFTGGPMGIDNSTFGGPTAVGEHPDNASTGARGAGERLGNAIDDYLNAPGPADYPTNPPPADAGPPPAGPNPDMPDGGLPPGGTPGPTDAADGGTAPPGGVNDADAGVPPGGTP